MRNLMAISAYVNVLLMSPRIGYKQSIIISSAVIYSDGSELVFTNEIIANILAIINLLEPSVFRRKSSPVVSHVGGGAETPLWRCC